MEEQQKPLFWLGSSKKDLRALPDEVQDTFGFALHMAQEGKKHEQAKPLKGFGSAGVLEVVEDFRSGTYRAVYTVKVGKAIYVLHPEEVDSRHRNTQTRYGSDSGKIESGGNSRQRSSKMIEIEKSSSNVYADLESPDAGEMLVKARLASKIGEIIKHRHLTQQQAADILGMTQPKLSNMLRGQFRGVSEAKMLECLNRLGRDVQIIVRKTSRTRTSGRTSVVFA